jgi:hypothetical protein
MRAFDVFCQHLNRRKSGRTGRRNSFSFKALEFLIHSAGWRIEEQVPLKATWRVRHDLLVLRPAH